MAIARNLEFYLTETWIMDVSCFNANNKPLDLTAATVTFQVSDNRWNSMFTLNNISGIIVTNAVGGECSVVVISGIQATANIVDKIYLYELQVTLQDGTVTSQCVGHLQVLASLFGPNN